MFRELFFRKGFSYDNVYDWDLLGQPAAAPDPTGAPMTPSGAAAGGGDRHGADGAVPMEPRAVGAGVAAQQMSADFIDSRIFNDSSVLRDKSSSMCSFYCSHNCSSIIMITSGSF